MFTLDSLGHVNIVVPDIDEATAFYRALFNASVEQSFPRFKNVGFANSAGFLENPESVDVSIRFLKVPFFSGDFFLELFAYQHPAGDQKITFKRTNDMGGPRHICIRVTNIDDAFAHVKSIDGAQLISESPAYKPFQISPIVSRAVELPEKDGGSLAARQSICEIVKQIRFFLLHRPLRGPMGTRGRSYGHRNLKASFRTNIFCCKGSRIGCTETGDTLGHGRQKRNASRDWP